MELILDRCDKATREEITLGQSPEYDVTTGGILKFITKMRKACTNSKGKDVFFGSSITRITEHHIRPATRVKELLAAHPDNDSIRNNTAPCNVSLDNSSDTKSPISIDLTKEPVKITTTPMSIEIDNNINVVQDSAATTATLMSTENDNRWYDANAKYDLWHDAAETIDNYQEWTDPPTVLRDGNKNKPIIKHIKLHVFETLSKVVNSTPIAICNWINKPRIP